MTRRSASRAAALTAVAACALALAACGSSSKSTTTTVKVTKAGTGNTAALVSAGSAPKANSTGTLVPAPFAPTNVNALLQETLPRLFSTGSPWNQPADTLGIDPASSQLLFRASFRLGATEVAGHPGTITTRRTFVRDGVYINTVRWTDPVVTDQGGTQTGVFCRQVYCGPDAVGLDSLKLPAGVSPDPRFDGWFTAVDTGGDVAYDLWRGRRQINGTVSFQYVKKWNLAGPGYQPPYSVSARGSGLPLFAGLITLADLRSGQINHALAISVPGPAQRNFVQPASSTDGNGSTDSLPEGARIRLKPNVQLSHFPRGGNRRLADAIVAALVRYGAIVVDRARVPTLYAQKDVSARYLQGNELQSLHLGDFAVVSMPPRLPFPNPNTTQTGPQTFTPSQGLGGGA